jgi:hypothetical protein
MLAAERAGQNEEAPAATHPGVVLLPLGRAYRVTIKAV